MLCFFFGWTSPSRGWGVSIAVVAIYQTTGLLRLRISDLRRCKQTNRTEGPDEYDALTGGRKRGKAAAEFVDNQNQM